MAGRARAHAQAGTAIPIRRVVAAARHAQEGAGADASQADSHTVAYSCHIRLLFVVVVAAAVIIIVVVTAAPIPAPLCLVFVFLPDWPWCVPARAKWCCIGRQRRCCRRLRGWHCSVAIRFQRLQHLLHGGAGRHRPAHCVLHQITGQGRYWGRN